MANALEKIARQVNERTVFSPLAISRATDAVVDTLGCMLAGASDTATLCVRDAFFQEIGPQGASAVIGGGRASASVTALINGTAAHCLDFDDNFHPARAHSSAVLVPALLSLATADAAISGQQFIHAYLAGLEAQAAVGFGVNPSHYNRGWHGTSTIGCIGTAAGVAILIGLTADGVARAMSIATSFAAGPKGQFGTLAKPLHAGLAARNAIEAALLAKAGLSGRPDILECPQGFLDLFGGDAPRGWQDLEFPADHVIETRGLVTKLHPCCASTHRAIDAARDLQDDYGFAADDILTVETKVGRSAVDNLAYSDPQDAMQARFSMQYCLAAALVQKQLSLADFIEAAVFRPEIRRHMPKISMTAFSLAEEVGVERLPHRVTVTLKDGRTVTTERLYATGTIEAPLKPDEKRRKFDDCLAWGGMTGVAGFYDDLSRLHCIPSVKAALHAIDRQ